jgi:hypothetical protein
MATQPSATQPKGRLHVEEDDEAGGRLAPTAQNPSSLAASAVCRQAPEVAADVKNVPGRKTDVNHATWLSELAAYGLIRGSCVPDRPTQELRSVLCTCKDANIKLDSVISYVLGVSGRAMIEAMIAGQTNPPSWPPWRTGGSRQRERSFARRSGAA